MNSFPKNVTFVPLKHTKIIDPVAARKRSSIPLISSPHGAFALSSRNPVNIMAKQRIIYKTLSTVIGRNRRLTRRKTVTKIKPAPVIFPFDLVLIGMMLPSGSVTTFP